MSTALPDSTLPSAPHPAPDFGDNRSLQATICFVVLVTLLLIGSNVWLAWRARQAEWHQAQAFGQNLGHAVAQQMDSMFSEIDRVLDGIVYELEREEMAPDALESLQPVLVNHVAHTDHLHGLFIYGKDGSWLVNTQPVQRPGANNSDRAYFIHHRDNPSTRTLIGSPIVSRSSEAWIIPVSRRINDSEGRFAGVALATVRLNHVLGILNGFDVGPEGAIALSHSDGTIMVRRPFYMEDMGRSIAGSPLHARLIQSRSGSIVTPSPIDGVRRLVTFEHTRNNPLAIAVAQSEDDVLAQWREATSVQAVGIFLLLSVVGIAGGYVIRTVKRRQDAERQLISAHGELMQAHLRLEHMAEHDGLTGVHNRRAYDRRITEVLAQCRRNRRPVSVVMFDVDLFKSYNDILGHLQGDECLRQVAKALSGAIRRPGDFIARYGGEEFAMVLPETDTAGAYLVASAARSAVSALGIPHPGSPFRHVTVSGGVASCAWDCADRTPRDLTGRADTALYAAKQEGRNRVAAAAEAPAPAGEPEHATAGEAH
ncbi:diguanylate cyclase (GGDEF)-like protein [Paracidovorax anthurii]|uniref:diguanylate cyclase n=2 Tax=Paracidovorax anthurii TaxID=78229 RepID=A0A328ZJ72_9BURK|nr:sensor domain-containing diguanylate cyclase [Paracidovorax anthurii]RAR85654.1 diguanylate cyclase (GGDEF)-like protein [Paracidovorax anthurii]